MDKNKTIKEYVQGLTDEELKEQFRELEDIIHVVECFNVRDIVLMYAINNELIKRGYTRSTL